MVWPRHNGWINIDKIQSVAMFYKFKPIMRKLFLKSESFVGYHLHPYTKFFNFNLKYMYHLNVAWHTAIPSHAAITFIQNVQKNLPSMITILRSCGLWQWRQWQFLPLFYQNRLNFWYILTSCKPVVQKSIVHQQNQMCVLQFSPFSDPSLFSSQENLESNCLNFACVTCNGLLNSQE